MSDKERINQIIDQQLKNEEISFNWVTIFNKNTEEFDLNLDDNSTDDSFSGVMVMNLILVFIKYANALSDIQLSELFELLLTEMHGSWVGDTQIPILTVSNENLLSSYIF
jgi:disulfide oxidoreductase YuzD